MPDENELKVRLGVDRGNLDVGIDAAKDSILQAATIFKKAADDIIRAMQQAGAGTAQLNREASKLTNTLSGTGSAAAAAGRELSDVGKVASGDITVLDQRAKSLQNTLRAGFPSAVVVIPPPRGLDEVRNQIDRTRADLNQGFPTPRPAVIPPPVGEGAVHAAMDRVRADLNSGFQIPKSVSVIAPKVSVTTPQFNFDPSTASAQALKSALLGVVGTAEAAANEIASVAREPGPLLDRLESQILQVRSVLAAGFSSAVVVIPPARGVNEAQASLEQIRTDVARGIQPTNPPVIPPVQGEQQVHDTMNRVRADMNAGFQAPKSVSVIAPQIIGDSDGITRVARQAEDAMNGAAATFRSGATSIANSSQLINQYFARVAAEMALAGKGARAAADGLSDFARAPLKDLHNLDNEIARIKLSISRGFTGPTVKISAPTGTLQAFQRELKNTQTHMDALNARAKQLSPSLNAIRPSAGAATGALTDVSRVIQDLPFGIIGLQNNFNPLIESFARLKASVAGQMTVWQALRSSLVGAGGIGLAVAAVSAAFTLWQQGGITGFISKSKKAKEATDELADAQKNIVSGLAQEASKVSQLVAAIELESTSKERRLRLIEELNDASPAFFAKLKDEKDLIDKLGQAYNAYIQNIIRAAKSKIWEKKLEKLLERQIEIDLALEPTTDTVKSFTNTGKQGADAQVQAFKDAYFPSMKEVTKNPLVKGDITKAGQIWSQYGAYAGEKWVEGSTGVLRGTRVFNTIAPQLQQEKAAIGAEVKGILNILADLGQTKADPLKNVGDKPDKALKDMKELLDGYKKRLQDIQTLTEAGIFPKTATQNNIAELKEIIERTEQAIDQRDVALKLKPSLDIDPQVRELNVDKIRNELAQNLQFGKMQVTLPLTIDTKKAVTSRLQESANEALAKAGLTEYKIPSITLGEITLPIGGIQIAGGVDAIVKSAQEKIEARAEAKKRQSTMSIGAWQVGISDAQFEATVAEFEALGKSSAEAYNLAIGTHLSANIGQTITEGIVSAFTNLGEAIGNIINGDGGVGAAASSFINLIGDIISKIGVQIIMASTFMAKAAAAVKVMLANPLTGAPASIIAGVALVAVGQILKNIQFGTQKLASGGITTAPTLATIGERTQEAIIPLNRMSDMFAPNGMEVEFVHSKVLGADIYQAWKVQNRREARTA